MSELQGGPWPALLRKEGWITPMHVEQVKTPLVGGTPTSARETCALPNAQFLLGAAWRGWLYRLMNQSNPPDAATPDIYRVLTKASGPAGSLPLTEEMLLNRPSGDELGLTQNACMGWDPRELGRKQVLILSTQGGLRASDGTPIALGYHTGHWEIGLLVQAAAQELRALGTIP